MQPTHASSAAPDPDQCILWGGRAALYQAKAIEAYYVQTGFTPSEWAWVTTTCESDCLNAEHIRFTEPVTLEYPKFVCVYCGRSGYTKDHLLPRHWSGKSGRAYVVTVPACVTCNSLLGDTLTWSITERRAICHARLRRKFRKVLRTVEYGPSDLAEFGPNLRDSVIEAMADKRAVMEMLAWPEDPAFDLRACQRSGIDDPYAIGYVIDQREADRIAREVA